MVTVIKSDPSDPHMHNPVASGDAPSRSPGEGVTGSQSFEIDVDGMTAQQARRWIDVQIPYPNLAGNEEIATRAVGFVKQIRERWDDGTTESREKWRSLQYMLRGGNTLSNRFEETDVHVAELYMLVEQLVPRIEEALITSYDPWFQVKGRRRITQHTARRLGAFLMSQLRDDNFEHKVQPAVRAMIEYGFGAFKVFWDIQTEERVAKTVKDLGTKDGKKRYRMERELRSEVVWNGPRIKLIDPLDMLVDLRSVFPPYDALYVGDSSWYTLDELYAQQDLGLITNVDQIQEGSTEGPEPGWREFDKQSRSVERFNNRHTSKIQGAPKRVRVTELWCKYDLGDGGGAKPYVITVADERICLRVQENFHDDKHVPYAIARCSREGWEFLNVAPLDHGLSIQVSIDNHRNLVLKSHENHLAPVLLTDDASGLPDSLFDAPPGSVWQTDAQRFEWMQSPSTLGEYAGIYNIERTNLEEIVGAPRLYQGQGGSNTATESERKVQEANRRVRGHVLSFAFMVRSILEQMHALNKQFVTHDMPFQVIGKAAKHLGMYDEIGPNELQHDVDFDFVGIGALPSLNLRATQLQSFLSSMYPFIAQQPGVFNIPEVIRESWETMVGTQPADRVVLDPGTTDDMLPQDEENILLKTGEPVPVHPLDVDAEHLATMLVIPDVDDPEKLSARYGDAAAEAILSHLNAHIIQMKKKAVQKQAEDQRQPAVPGQVAAYDAGRGTTGNRQMAPGRPSLDNGTALPGQTPGETPGPPHSSRMGAPDRNAAMPQPGNLP